MKPPKSSDNRTPATKTRYLSGISHELRTPLNVIMGYAQLLENQAADDDPHKDKYTLMRHNCEHLSHLIEGILEFSAIEAGKLKVQFETTDLQALLKQVIAVFNHQAEQKGLKFSSQIDVNLPKQVKTDPKRLQQILMNLISNAIKFTEVGHIEFKITYRNQVATFTINDSGRGIESDDLSRIFEPFERIEQANKPIKGTGLGLPITQLLVNLMGGEISVSSTIGLGSEFKVKLMLAPISHHPINQSAAINENQFIATNPLKQNALHHIIVIDDERTHRDILIEILTPQDFKTDTAAHAKEAQKMSRQQFYSLAIIDVAMPDTNGWQLASWFKQHSPQTKIIMLSANPRNIESSSDKMYDAYLTKPLIIDQLLNEIGVQLKLVHSNCQSTTKKTQETAPLNLDKEHTNALLHMFEIGHINGIINYLKNLQQQQTINDRQYTLLSQPIKNMNLKAFKAMIDHEI